MATSLKSLVLRQDWRVILFRIIVGLVGLFYLTIGSVEALALWNIRLVEMPVSDALRWYQAGCSAYAIFFGALPLFALLKNSRKNVFLMQFWMIGTTLFTIAWLLASFRELEFDKIIVLVVVLMA
jgi:hypothetical protein